MLRRNRYGLRLDANYTEDVVGFALESFLAVMTFPRRRFSIEPFSRAKERWLGADARLHSEIRGFRPFYMQFKRPSAYPDFSSAGIIKDRKALNRQVSPHALYFDLRNKQPHHRDFQHNILLRLRRRLQSTGLGDAAYVCPLFLDRSAYRTHLHWSGLSHWFQFWHRDPWDLEDVLLNNGGNTIRFDNIPVLAEHITVPPHNTVTTANHRYSFTEAGTELCFHSPEYLPDGASNLAQFLMALSQGFLDRGKKISAGAANEELENLIKAAEIGSPDDLGFKFADGGAPFANWLEWGDYLRHEYGIEQYAFVSWEA